MSSDSDRDKIGYRRPPEHTRFAKGKSGNPSGRRKGSKNLAAIVRATVNAVVPVTENGRRRKVTKLEAAVTLLVNKAATGDSKATQSVLQLMQLIEGRSESPAQAAATDEADRQVMDHLLERIRASNG